MHIIQSLKKNKNKCTYSQLKIRLCNSASEDMYLQSGGLFVLMFNFDSRVDREFLSFELLSQTCRLKLFDLLTCSKNASNIDEKA